MRGVSRWSYDHAPRSLREETPGFLVSLKGQASMPITKCLHQVWLDKHNPDFRGYPEHRPTYKTYAASWQKHHPDWEYKLWNNREFEALLNRPGFEAYADLYHNRIRKHIEKCDFARYLILYVYGGVYVDLDFECLRNLGPLTANRELGLVPEALEHQFFYKEMICNSFIMSAPGRIEWKRVLDTMVRDYHPARSVPENTGPCLLRRTIPLTPENTIPSCAIIPLTYYNHSSWGCRIADLDAAYCHPHWTEGTYWWFEDVERWVGHVQVLWPLLLLFIVVLLLRR